MTHTDDPTRTTDARDWQAYPAYKPSGVEWLGDIPAHWEVRRVKNIARLAYGDTLLADDRDSGEFPVYGSNGVVGYHSSFNTQSPAMVIGRKGSYGKINFSETECYAIDTTFFIDSTTTKEDLYWLYYALLVLKLDSFSQDSAVPGLSREFVYNNTLPVPPPEEQRQIADFLDHQTAKLDTLIAKKRALIARLEEKRAALISHAVTKGLDPAAPMQDSGIEWLGDIPSHWEVVKLGYISHVVRGGSPRPAGDSRFFGGDAYAWITVAEITKDNRKYLTRTENYLTEEGKRQSRLLRQGTLVLTNSGATLGVPKILKIDGCINDGSVAFLKLSHRVEIDFLYYFLLSMTENYRERIRQGSGQPNLNTDIVRHTYLALGSPSEQTEIVEFLDSELDKMDHLIEEVLFTITRLEEYRTALISAAVTGKIDVRGWSVNNG